jgi:beta-phosphoglucomutase-like phosphatase (HAD superfamily)
VHRLDPKGKEAAAWVFDLDGTLVDTVGTRIVAWLRTFEEFGIPADRKQVSGLIGSDGRRMAQVVAEAAGQAMDSARAEEVDRRSGDVYSELNTNPSPLRGATELLHAFDERGGVGRSRPRAGESRSTPRSTR